MSGDQHRGSASNGHVRLVARSRALHRVVAEKIRDDPDLMRIVRDNLDRWITNERAAGEVSPLLLEWKKIVDTQPLPMILDLICEESERADRLRHATPFCGILTEEERAAIYQRHAPPPA